MLPASIRWIMLVSGALTCTMVYAAIAPQAMLRWLVQRGASPDIADRERVTARQKASRKRDQRFFEALLLRTDTQSAHQ